MEGVSYEASSLAGTNALGKLVYFYDDNHITIDGTTAISFTEDRAKRFEALQDELEERIARLAEEENLQALRPALDGDEIMEHLDLAPGPLVGEAWRYLMEVRLDRGLIERAEAERLLDEWAREKGIGS